MAVALFNEIGTKFAMNFTILFLQYYKVVKCNLLQYNFINIIYINEGTTYKKVRKLCKILHLKTIKSSIQIAHERCK